MKAARLFFIIAFLLTGLILFNTSYLLAGSTTNKYEVYLTQFQLYNSDTGQWVTIYNGSSVTLDIASQSGSGILIGNFLAGLTVPDGNYTKAKATPSTTFVIRGSTDDLGGPYYTTATTATDGSGRIASVATTTAGNIADCTTVMLSTDVVPPAGGVSFGGTLSVTNGIPNRKVRVYFDLSNALVYVAGGGTGGENIIYPSAPTITIELVSD
jgi:hypothetical protein